MTALYLVAVVVLGTASLIRWLRVSQREHYLPGSVWAVSLRWLRQRPPNALLGIVWLALSTLAGVAAVQDSELFVAGLLAGVVAVIFPFGLPIVGHPRLKLTPRATRQGLAAAALLALWTALVGLALGMSVAIAVVPIAAVFGVDAAASAIGPVERRLGARFQNDATKKLERVRPRIVAVTGSYGKTTVKNHIRDLMSESVNVVATPASWNNRAGLSRAINEHLTPGTEVFVAEMGTYGPGEIDELVQWLKPEVGVITAVGPVHLERMRTIEVITRAKSEVLRGVRAGVICVDSPELRALGSRTRATGDIPEVWLVGGDDSADELDVLVRREPRGSTEYLVVTVHDDTLGEVPAGSLHAGNVACAVAACLAIGIEKAALASGLSRLSAPANRAVVATTDAGLVVIDDTFNSNPAGAASAVATLAASVEHGRRVVVTPGMVELGHLQVEKNRELAELVSSVGAELVIVGWTNRRALLAGHPSAHLVADREAARAWVRANLGEGDGVLWENDLPDHYA